MNNDHEAELSQEDHNVIKGLKANDILAMEFESVEEAEKWYMKYAKVIGLGVRKNNLRRNGKNEIVGRSWLCSCEGYRLSKHLTRIDRRRMHKPITRSGCVAQFHVLRDNKTMKFRVTRFVEHHTGHEVVGSKYSYLIRTHRSMTDADIAQVNSMRACGIRTAHIMGYMVG